MKKILVTTLVAAALVSSALAQGTVTFTSPVGSVKYMDNGVATAVPVGNPAQIPGYGNLNIAAYWADSGTSLSLVGGLPDLSAWTLATPTISRIFPAAGAVLATDFTTGAAASTPVQLEIVAWTGDFATFQEASAGNALLAWTGDSNSGGMLGWTQPTGGGTSPGQPLVAGAYNGLVLAPIPEPSTFALAGLGAAALLIFRRRK